MKDFFVKHPIIAGVTVITVVDTVARAAIAVSAILKGGRDITIPWGYSISIGPKKSEEKGETKKKEPAKD